MILTPGRILFEETIPPKYRAAFPPDKPIDKKAVETLLQRIAEEDPDLYSDISHKLLKLGGKTSYETRSSFSLADLKAPEEKKIALAEIEAEEDKIFSMNLSYADRNKELIKLYGRYAQKMPDVVYQAAMNNDNTLAHMVAAGARGNKSQLNSNLGMDGLMVDFNNNPVPIGIKNSYAEGLSPAEYFAGSYGTRKGLIATKFATQDSGFFGKQLAFAAGDLVVTEDDCGTSRGMPHPVDNDDIGGVLAVETGGHPAGTVITADVLEDIKESGADEVVLRSPATCQARGGGICAHCAGVRERNRFPSVMENVGLAAASALSEPLSQGALSEKHSGGVASGRKTLSGFKLVNQLAQVPKVFQDRAAVSETDGRVSRIVDAPQGGWNVFVGEQEHYVPPVNKVLVKIGDEIEAGDQISDGIVSPADMVRLKGIGEGRRYFVQSMTNAFKEGGIGVSRRNVEVLARAMINHVAVDSDDGLGDYLPEDVVNYEDLERTWKPRDGTIDLSPADASNKFLEKPVLHYSIGTRVTPSVRKNLEKYKVQSISVHDKKPPFQPYMVRLMEQSGHKDDWMGQLYGSYLKKNIQESVWEGKAKSDPHGVNFVPGLARGQDFGTPPPEQKGVGY